MTLQGYWADLKAPAFKALPDDLVVVLPLGATEQHGPHLPLSVDTDLISGVTDRMLTHLDPSQSVLVLPALSVTKSGEHDSFPGTLSLSADTLLAVLRDIGASLARAGVTRLVMFNGHGGNTALLDIVARDLRKAHDMIVVHASWFGFAEFNGVLDQASLVHDIHAGDSETSPMLALKPEAVDMAQARNFRPAMADWAETHPMIGLSSQPARPGWLAEDVSDEGACGNAAAATPEKGEKLIESAARNFAAFLADFAGFDHRRRRDA